jgi:CoA:oxalate CoA-transferase
MSAPRPLEGIRVLDLTRALAGPYCTALLSDLGAQITKVESISGGDITRSWPPFQGEHSLYFESINRGKSSIALDFYSPEGKALLRRLALASDVVVENFRSGVMADIGLDPDELRAEKPALVIASVSGYGNTGPLADAAGLDQVAQGMSGLMSVTGADPEHIYRFGVPIIDTVAGTFCALGIVAALVGRGATGTGAAVSTSLLESALALSTFHGQKYLSTGEVPVPNGNDHSSLTPYGVFRTADIPIIIAVGNEKQWHQFCALLGAPALADDPRYVTGRLRTQHRDELKPALEDLLGSRTASEWMSLIRAAGIPTGPIYTYDQVFQDEQVRALGVVDVVERSDGSALPLLRGPLSINGATAPVTAAPPDLGAQTIEVLRDLELAGDEIEALLAASVVSSPRTATAIG